VSERYAHLVEDGRHPFQALCGAEQVWQNEGPEPPICPKCLEIYESIDDPTKVIVRDRAI
jgi:hypothetical protein